jgi:hypothetical protein
MDFEHLPNDCSPPKIVSKMSSSFISQKIKRMMNAKMDDESVSNDDSPFPLNSTENFRVKKRLKNFSYDNARAKFLALIITSPLLNGRV